MQVTTAQKNDKKKLIGITNQKNKSRGISYHSKTSKHTARETNNE